MLVAMDHFICLPNTLGMTRRLPRLLLFAGLALALAVACAGGDEEFEEFVLLGAPGGAALPAPTARPQAAVLPVDGIQPCDLIGFSAARALLGVEVAAAQQSSGSISRCTYESDSQVRLLELYIETGVSLEAFQRVLDNAGAQGEVRVILSSSADETVWWPTRELLVARYLDAYIQVVVGTNVTEPGKQTLSIEAVDLLIAGIDALNRPPIAAATPAPTPRPAGTPVPASPARPDVAARSFEDNLLLRVGEGDWTLGAGLVATLGYLAGEVDEDQVLRSPDFQGFETTGVMAMALDYLENGQDAEARVELQRLLDRLVFTEQQLDALAVPAPQVRSGSTRPVSLTFQQEPVEEDCQRFYQGIYPVAAGVDECLLVFEQTTGGVLFRTYLPSIEEADTGWSEADVLLVKTAIDEAVQTPLLELGSLPSPMLIVFSATNSVRRAAMSALPQADGGGCTVTVFRAAQNPVFSDADFKQLIVHEFAHCFQNATFPDQQAEYPDRRWREEGYAEYLSSVAYPINDEEFRFIADFLEYELSEATISSVAGEVFGPSGSRSYENVIWFHFLRSQFGDGGILDFIRSGPTTDGLDAQIAFLEDWPGIEELHHDFHLAVTDGTIEDGSGAPYPKAEAFSARPRLDETAVVATSLGQFGVARFLLTVPEGMVATTTLEEGAELSVSARPNESPGEWLPVTDGDEFSAGCDADSSFLLVVTSTQDASPFFSLRVTQIEESEECATPTPTPEPTPEVGLDSCLVGEWRLDLPEYLTEIVRRSSILLDAEEHRIRGRVTLLLSADGSLVLTVEGYREVHTYSFFESFATAEGRTEASWSTSDSVLRAVYEREEIEKIVTHLENPSAEGNFPGPPVFILPANEAPYSCGDDSFTTTQKEHPIRWLRQ